MAKTKAELNWAVDRAQGLWFALTERPPQTEFIMGVTNLLRKTRNDAIGHARGRIKVLLHREAANLSDEQRSALFRAIDMIK